MKGANLTTVEMLTALGSRCNAKELKEEKKSKRKSPWRTETQLCLLLHVLKTAGCTEGFSPMQQNLEEGDGLNTDQFVMQQNETYWKTEEEKQIF